MNADRLKAERKIYGTFDILDPSGANTDFWKAKLAKMSDKQFKDYIATDFPFYLQVQVFKEPDMNMIYKVLDFLGVPAEEEIFMPYKYKDPKTGRPIRSKKCLVLYIPMKRMKQMIIKKNGMSINTDSRDMKTGLLTGDDKNGKESDREMESLAVYGMTATIREFSRARADSMNDKAVMNNIISNLGQVSYADLPNDKTDSLSKNLLNSYFIGAQLKTNLISDDYYLPKTLRERESKQLIRQ